MLTARAVRKLRPVAEARWELRRWEAVLHGTKRAARIRRDIEQITETGEIPRMEQGHEFCR